MKPEEIAQRLLTPQDILLYKNFIFFSSASLLGNFFAFLYHFYSARNLSVPDYGALNALLSLFGVLVLPFASFSALLVKKVAQEKSRAYAACRLAVRISLLFSAALLALVLAFPQQLNSAFHIEDPAVPLFFWLAVSLALLWISLNGVLQGLGNFFLSGSAFAAGSLAKLALAFLFVLLGSFTLSTAIASYGIAFLIAAGMAAFGLRGFFAAPKKAQGMQGMKGDYAKIAGMDMGFALLFNGDLVVLGMLFPGEQLGFYSAASIVAKIISYALLPLAAVAFPKMVEQSWRKQSPKALFLTLAVVLAGGAGILAFYQLAGAQFLSILYTERYLPAMPYLMVLSLAMVLYCLNMASSRYFAAVGSRLYSALAIILPAAGLFLIYATASMELAPAIMLAANLALFLSGALLFLSGMPQRQRLV
ncbi:MAG: oligosaccharide flippase family protein [Candidatus Micrarchaeota archaeon]|nr:oligosaccharide flippase family protein [Candidatus Micrarchaeota archaeon]